MNFSEFEEYMLNDIKANSVYNVRFVGVNSMSMWCAVKSVIIGMCGKQILLSDYCRGEAIPNMAIVKRDIKNITQTAVLLPLSEILRLNNTNIFDTLLSIAKTELRKNVKLYVPMYNMNDYLEKLAKEDIRLKDNIIYVHDNEYDAYSLTVLSDKLDFDIDGNNIYGMDAYLKYWEDKPSKPIILHTANAVYYKENTYADNVTILISASDLVKYCGGFYENIPDSEQWAFEKLLSELKIHKTADEVYFNIFGTRVFDEKILFSAWREYDDFAKWLIWAWSKNQTANKYLVFAVSDCGRYTDFYQNIICRILDKDVYGGDFKQMYEERRRLLRYMQVTDFGAEFYERYNDNIRYLTDVTTGEKSEIILKIKNSGYTESTAEWAESNYRYLYCYLKADGYLTGEIGEYFNKYKMAKIRNDFTDVSALADKYAAEKGIFWDIPPRDEYTADRYDDNTLIIWADGLGAEFLGFFTGYMADHHMSLHYSIGITRANIPTVTANNQSFASHRNIKIFRDLDKLKHSGEYPEYIAKELDMYAQIIAMAAENVQLYDKVVIVSDHGMSRGAAVGGKERYKAEESTRTQRYGRYGIDKTAEYEGRIISCADIDEYHVFLNYDCFSGKGRPKCEVHGGASLEEIIVPVIEISRFKEQPKKKNAVVKKGIAKNKKFDI